MTRDFSLSEVLSLKMLAGHVLVELVAMNDKVTFQGMEFSIDTSFEPSDHVAVCGTVISTPEQLLFQRGNPESMFWKTDMEILPGDTAYFDYHSAMMALGGMADKSIQFPNEKYFVAEKRLFVMIPYQDIFCVIRFEKEVIPINGYVLVKPILKENDTGGLPLPFHLRLSQEQNKGVVLFVGKPNKEYLSDKVCDVTGFDVHDIIHYRQTRIRRLEYDLHATLPKGIIVIQSSDIMATVTEN